MSAALPLLSPLVTRILEISGFPPELKTRDIQAIFAPWEDDRGGFRIKWVDDTTALVIFADAAPAKRAYLQTLMAPPPSLMTSTGVPARIRPYDGDDAASIISSVQNRPRSRSNAGGQATPAYGASPSEEAPIAAASPPLRTGATGSPRSIGKSLMSGHRRSPSGSNASLPAKPLAAALFDAANGGPSPAHHLANAVAAEAAAAAAAQAASGNDQRNSPDLGHHLPNVSALKSLPMNPMTSRPGGNGNESSLGLDTSPADIKKSNSNGAGVTEVV